MTIIGTPRTFHKKFKFIVEIDDIAHAGFQKCSELSVEVANIQYFEGGSLIPNKSPGRLTFADVTLERGATQDRDLFDWFQDVAITASGLGLTTGSPERSRTKFQGVMFVESIRYDFWVHGRQSRGNPNMRCSGGRFGASSCRLSIRVIRLSLLTFH